MTTAYVIQWKWGTSRGQDSYGYTICSCYIDGQKSGSTCGGGYDLRGTAYAEAVLKMFHVELRTLAHRADSQYRVTGKGKDQTYARIDTEGQPGLLYGLYAYFDEKGKVTKISLDGACGLESMDRIMEAIGYKREFVMKDVSKLVGIGELTHR